jgi:hypothetical protein
MSLSRKDSAITQQRRALTAQLLGKDLRLKLQQTRIRPSVRYPGSDPRDMKGETVRSAPGLAGIKGKAVRAREPMTRLACTPPTKDFKSTPPPGLIVRLTPLLLLSYHTNHPSTLPKPSITP